MRNVYIPKLNKIFIALTVFVLLLAGIEVSNAATASSISQYGVTFTFDKAYEYGTFANGDYWVKGPVTITTMTPDFTGTANGAMVNPTQTQAKQGFRTGDAFDAAYNLSLPYTSPASGIVSVCKSITTPTSNTYSYLTTMVVLTIVTETPSGNGATVFRPPYAGTDKTYHYLTEIKKDRVLMLSSSAAGLTYEQIATYMKMPQIELGGSGLVNRELKPTINMATTSSYQPEVTYHWNDAIATLNLNDTYANKFQSIIYVLQAGIDLYYAIRTRPPGYNEGGGGHQPGKKMLVGYAGYILDNTGMQALVNGTSWWENQYIRNALWGEAYYEDQYWQYAIVDPGSNREYQDPYRFIDGGSGYFRPINGYQQIVAMNVKGEALLLKQMPGMAAFWSDSANFIAYGQRWVDHGLLMRRDPCAPAPITNIESITLGNPTTITSRGHSVQNGDQIRIGKLLGADAGLLITGINKPSLIATVIDANTFSVPVNTIGKTISVDAGVSYYAYGYGRVWGNDPNSTMCILDTNVDYYMSPTDWACKPGKDCGRFPASRDAMSTDDGSYRSSLIDSLWRYGSTYRSTAERPLPPKNARIN